MRLDWNQERQTELVNSDSDRLNIQRTNPDKQIDLQDMNVQKHR